jgi:DNA-directed RNA polymerase subunit RPC12/RpoP
MPAAHTILYVLAGFIGCWSLSLVLRGLFTEYDKRTRRCPACGKAMPTGGDSRSAGEDDAGDREDQATDDMRCPSCDYLAEREREFFARRRCWPMVIAGSILLLTTPVLFVYAEAVKKIADPFGTTSPSGWSAVGLGVVSFGVALGIWAYRGDRSHGRRRCPKCWYDMRGLPVLRCPECGREVPHERHLYRPRRRWRVMPVALVLVLVGLNLRLIPLVQRGGYVAAVPTTVLIAIFEHLPDQFVINGTPNASEDMSLDGRRDDDQLWHWQERWLRHRVRRIVFSESSIDALARASYLWDRNIHGDRNTHDMVYYNHMFRGALRASIDPSPRVRARSQEVPFYLNPEELDDESRTALSDAVPDLINAIVDTHNSYNVTAIYMIGLAGADAEPAIPILKRALECNVRWESYSSARTLSQLSRSLDSAMTVLLDALESTSPMARHSSGQVLRSNHWNEIRIQTRMLDLLREGDIAVASSIADVLPRRSGDAGRTIPAVLAQVRTGRVTPYVFLRNFDLYGNEAEPYVPDVIAFLDDPDPGVRIAAARCLENLAYNSTLDLTVAVPALQRLAKEDEEETVRKAALDVLVVVDH